VEKPDLTVAVVPAVDSAGFFVALHQGLFRARGLNVKFVPAVSSETVIAGQAAGEYDITGGFAGNWIGPF
jgi:NitT/TauT family transport system substrate-binding protein